MADVPRFALPPSLVGDQLIDGENPHPRLQVRTEVRTLDSHRLAVPHRTQSASSTTIPPSTPPESPTKDRLAATGICKIDAGHTAGAMTPPVTPTSLSHRQSTSISSDLLNTLPSLYRADSLSPTASPRCSIDESVRSSSTDLIDFPHHEIDYVYRTDSEGRKKPVGEGLWSDVFLAKPKFPGPTSPSLDTSALGSSSPLLTPTHSRESRLSFGSSTIASFPYAVKVPASTSAKKVLLAEARILSYLSRFPDADTHVVPFYGFDSRKGSLVLKAMEGTLESWIQKELNHLDELSRARKLAAIFPSISLSLIRSLQWLHSKGCIHADVKPSNALISDFSTEVPSLVFSDFSSTILTKPGAKIDAEASPAGAGTWDYLDPQLLTSTSNAPPSATSDLWSLAITLLFLVLGSSPYDCFKHNSYQQREMIRHGIAIHCLAHDAAGIRNMKRISALSADLGFDVLKWFGKVLVKDPSKRVGIAQWCDDLVIGLAKKGAGTKI